MSNRRSTGLVIVVVGLLVAVTALLVVAISGRTATETRAQQAHEIASGVRCPVCKDLSAADSPAPLARQMRVQIREQLDAGDTPAQIRARFVSAYGPSVLMSPPNTGWGRVVVLAPLAVLVIATLLGAWLVRRAIRVSPDRLIRHGAAPRPSLSEEAPRAVLRQLGDLEDDLATGRVDEADYQRLRDLLESQGAARRSDEAAPSRRHLPDQGPDTAPAPRRRVVRWVAGVAVGTGAAVAVVSLLAGATNQRAPGTVATGDAPAAVPDNDRASATSKGSTVDQLSPEELTAVESAVDEVKRSPRRASAHVDLARAYSQVRQPQLATVEYLAATQLEADNPEANTALALVAFEAGSVQQAQALTNRVLRAHPGYPEALYTRGLIRAMGLHHTAAATRDLKAYQKAAPLGSHSTTVATVLALLSSDAIK